LSYGSTCLLPQGLIGTSRRGDQQAERSI